MTAAVLALQGAFAEHERMLSRLGVPCIELRRAEDLLRPFGALILPGGESTAQAKLLRETGMFAPLKERIAGGLPVFGTCAGLLLLAEQVEGGSPCFGEMAVCAVRNAYGRQLGSFHAEGTFRGIGNVPMTFIRAPYIRAVFPGAEVLAETGGRIVAARQKNMLVTAFHPELCGDPSVHAYFLEMARGRRE